MPGAVGTVVDGIIVEEDVPITTTVCPALSVAKLTTVVLPPVPRVIGGPPGASVCELIRNPEDMGVTALPAMVSADAGAATGADGVGLMMVEDDPPTITTVLPAEFVARLMTDALGPSPSVIGGAPGASVWLEITNAETELGYIV